MVTGEHTIDEHLSLTPAPGHTPGTVVVTLASKGDSALFCGDVLHHALQVYYPRWNSFVCADAEAARHSRREVLERCSGSGARLLPAHFGAPFICHIEAKGDGFVPRFG
jgi:glyoxylase-like metal-dependent hydrolase (beta-lactamase superfamily II)